MVFLRHEINLKMKNMKNGILLIILGVSLIFMGFAIGISEKNVEPIIEEKIIYPELGEWDIFVMALVEVECGRNPLARSNKNAIGPFQITPIYVEETNRLYGTNYRSAKLRYLIGKGQGFQFMTIVKHIITDYGDSFGDVHGFQ